MSQQCFELQFSMNPSDDCDTQHRHRCQMFSRLGSRPDGMIRAFSRVLVNQLIDRDKIDRPHPGFGRSRFRISSRAFGFVTAGLLMAGTFDCLGQAAADEGIRFAHFRLTNGVVMLVRSTVVSGKLKARPLESRQKLEVALEDPTGKAVWASSIDDPLVRRLEYEDAAHPGRLKTWIVHVDSADFVVRMPYRRDVRRLSFYRWVPAGSTRSGLATSGPTATATRILINSIEFSD
jgi:hypothetical protein